MKSILVILLMTLNVFAMDILPKKYELKFIDGVNTLIFEDLLETNGVSYQDQTFRVFGLENRDGRLRAAVTYDVAPEHVYRVDGKVHIQVQTYDLNRNRNILSRRYIGLRTTVFTDNGTFKDRANTNWTVRRFSE